ncbi:MAG: hypothetical protein ACI4W2_04825 [Eubacterium sp.]
MEITEAVEMCPYCMAENTYPDYCAELDEYRVTCKRCGKEIMLCDECLHDINNPRGMCDWHEKTYYRGNGAETIGICWRGITRNYEPFVSIESYVPHPLSPGGGDTVHRIYDIGLKGGAKLHRFSNRVGTPFSAIYVDGHEKASCERPREAQMLTWWDNKTRSEEDDE